MSHKEAYSALWLNAAQKYWENEIDPVKFVEYLGKQSNPGGFIPTSLLTASNWINRFKEEYSDDARLLQANMLVERNTKLVHALMTQGRTLEQIVDDTTLGLNPLYLYCLAYGEGNTKIISLLEEDARSFLRNNPHYHKSKIAEFIPKGIC
jgi:hypothetical protein